MGRCVKLAELLLHIFTAALVFLLLWWLFGWLLVELNQLDDKCV